jgi:Chromo (CHRromatin Organisation MOdifier) domain
LPELLEGTEVYEVETILKHQRRGRGYQYYVKWKWKGYPITEAAWKNESAFSNDGDIIQLYKEQYQLWKPIGQ